MIERSKCDGEREWLREKEEEGEEEEEEEEEGEEEEEEECKVIFFGPDCNYYEYTFDTL